MILSDKDIEEFQRLYKNRNGKEISKELAYEQGIKLIRLLERIYKPMTKETFVAVQKRRLETLPAMLPYITSQGSSDVV